MLYILSRFTVPKFQLDCTIDCTYGSMFQNQLESTVYVQRFLSSVPVVRVPIWEENIVITKMLLPSTKVLRSLRQIMLFQLREFPFSLFQKACFSMTKGKIVPSTMVQRFLLQTNVVWTEKIHYNNLTTLCQDGLAMWATHASCAVNNSKKIMKSFSNIIYQQCDFQSVIVFDILNNFSANI